MKKPEAKPAKGAQVSKATVQPGKAPSGQALGKIEPVKATASAAAEPKKPPFNPVKFFTEVRTEARRITWPSRKETWITTVMVLIMVVLAAVFFFVVDGALGYLTSIVSKLGQ